VNTIEKFSPTGTDQGVFASTGGNILSDVAVASTPTPEPSSFAILSGLIAAALLLFPRMLVVQRAT
jgi:hypothetical protein